MDETDHPTPQHGQGQQLDTSKSSDLDAFLAMFERKVASQQQLGPQEVQVRSRARALAGDGPGTAGSCCSAMRC